MDIAECRDVVWFLLCDHNAETRTYSPTAVDNGVKAVLKLRTESLLRIGVAPNGTSFLPDPTPDEFALVCLHTAKAFRALDRDGYAWRSRALSVTVRGYRNALSELENRIFDLENQQGFRTYDLFANWLTGMGGLSPVWRFAELSGSPAFRTVAYPPTS